jgi:single-strand DNA-binding protein
MGLRIYSKRKGKKMINAIVVGNLGADAELNDAGGTPVLNFSLASNTRARVDGEWQDKTHWVRVAFFGQRAEAIEKFLKSGKTVAVRGELQTREYEGKNGKGVSLELRADDVRLLGGKRGKDDEQEETRPAPKAKNGSKKGR